MKRFDAAPWPASLKLVSVLGTVVLAGAAAAAVAAPFPRGLPEDLRFPLAAVPLLILLGAALFVVRGYRVEPDGIRVERLLTATNVPLSGLESAWADPAACEGSLRLFGNGGLFSFSGWYSNERLGRYRLFATDAANAVVLRFPGRVVVVSPASPRALVEHLQRTVPGLASASPSQRT